MKTNQNGHTLRNLTNRVMAVIDDAEHAQAAVETLGRAGVPERELATQSGTEGARETDADGVHRGGVTQAVQALQRLTVEGHHPRRSEAELAQGHLVIDVAAPGRRKRDTVVPDSRQSWRAVLKATIGELAPIALAKHMDIALNDGRDAFVSGDAGLLSILFRNVTDNAVRYSASGTKVDVDMEVAASDVRVTVRDAGPGIPAEPRAHVGRRFYRAPGTQPPGSGLGLSIVLRILDLHQGTIRLDSPATTSGLQVTIALPRVVG